MKRFLSGVYLVFKGIIFFYREKSLWKHTIGPWCFLAALYGALTWLIFFLSGKIALFLNSRLAEYPEFLRNLLSGSLIIAALIISTIVVLTTLSTFFEIFGSLFFDRMLEDADARYYHIIHEKLPLKKQLSFTCQGAWYGIKTTLLFIILTVLAFFLPVAGQILLIVLIGKRMGNSFLFAPGFLRGKSVDEISAAIKKHRPETAGFGICAYLIQMIPFSMPFTLPGIILGAQMLYNGKVCPESKDEAKR